MNAQVEKLLRKPITEITEKDYNLYLKFKRQGLISLNPYTEDIIQKIKEQNTSPTTITYSVIKSDVIDKILGKCVDRFLLQVFLNEVEYVDYLSIAYLQSVLMISYHNAITIMDFLVQQNVIDTKKNNYKILNRNQLKQVFEIKNLKKI